MGYGEVNSDQIVPVGRHLKARGIDTRAPKLGPDDVRQAADFVPSRVDTEQARQVLSHRLQHDPCCLLTAGVVMRPKGRKAS